MNCQPADAPERNPLQFHVLTLFPEIFPTLIGHSIVGQACERGVIYIKVTDIREYAHDAHGTADDYQFGGGPGMVMKAEPVFEAVEAAISGLAVDDQAAAEVILLSPQGRLLDQKMAEELATAPALVLICGHYSGVDDRVREHLTTREVSIGDYVLTGGELPAMILIDAVARLAPGVVGSPGSVAEDSITCGLLQHPLFTRPAQFRQMEVPEVLRSGHHSEIQRWRRRESLRRTFHQRADLLETADLTQEDLDYLASLGYHREPRRKPRP